MNNQDEGQYLNELFASLPLDDKRSIMSHELNKRRLQPLRNLLEKIALDHGDLRTYTQLRCSCRHFRKWLPPVLSDRVTQALGET